MSAAPSGPVLPYSQGVFCVSPGFSHCTLSFLTSNVVRPFLFVLSVLCIALDIKDIITAVPNGVICSFYVNDFVLHLSGSILPSALPWLQLVINMIADWADFHGLWFSVEKYHAILFRRT